MAVVVSRIRVLASRNPRVADACLAGLVAAVSVPVTAGGVDAPGVLEPGTGVTGAGWVWFAAVHVPLVWRRRAPASAFWAVLGLALACALIGGVTGVFLIFAPLCAVYAVARHRPPRVLWPVVVAAVLALGVSWARDTPDSPVMIGVASLTVATALAGVVLRMRKAYLEDRVRHRERERAQQEALAVAAERARIAREVHDIVAHNLTVMVALADGAAYAGPERAADTMGKVAATGREALAEMRRLVGLLRDADGRDPQPGFGDLDTLFEQVRAAGLRLSVTQSGVPGSWGPGAGLAVYRIVQEALTNTLKHAGAGASVQVRIVYTPVDADLEITDDGAGRPARSPHGGHGLAGMAERAGPYGGEVEAGPVAGSGWRVRARLRFDDQVLRVGSDERLREGLGGRLGGGSGRLSDGSDGRLGDGLGDRLGDGRDGRLGDDRAVS